MKNEYEIKFYNKDIRSIECYRLGSAGSDYWDKHWDSDSFRETVVRGRNKILESILQRHVSNTDKKVLEAGCGNGNIVYSLSNLGYDVTGIDFAENTVKRINKVFPDLNVSVGNVNNIPFEDDSFDIYISGGVIEHNKSGFDSILTEASRVVKNGGYLFIGFPYMSLIRRLKAIFGFYPNLITPIPDGYSFYEYIYSIDKFNSVCNSLKLSSYSNIKVSGLKGFKDEILLFRKPLGLLFSYKGRNRIIIAVRYFLTYIFTIFSAHAVWAVIKNDKHTS